MREEITEGYRLSPQQERLWSLLNTSNDQGYRALASVFIEGDLDTAILKRAAQDVVERHEILRTTFHFLQGINFPLQVITNNYILEIDNFDMTASEPGEQERKVDELFDRIKQQPFDFECGPLFRVSFAKLSGKRHVLFLSLFTLCADAHTLKNLILEIARAYEARATYRGLSAESIQYTVVSEWLNDLLESDDSEAAREYWRQRPLENFLDAKLPFDNQPSESSGFNPQSVILPISPDLASKIESLAIEYGVSISAFLATCWVALLWRLAGGPNVTIGINCHGRTDEEIERVLGLMAKYLPLTCEVEGDSPFVEVLNRCATLMEQADRWQEVFILEQMRDMEAQISGPSFFPISFDYEERIGAFSAGGLTFSTARQYVCIDRFHVKLSCIKSDDSLVTEFHYDSSSVLPTNIERLAAEFHTLLRSAATKPQTTIAELQIISEAERERLLVSFNDTQYDYSNNQCIHQWFERQVLLAPHKTAVVCGDEQLTYAELNAWANQIAHCLRHLGTGAGSVVGICMDRSLEMVIGLLGILKSGGAYLPLDPSYPKQRVAFMLADSQVSVLLSQSRLAGELSNQSARIIYLDSDDVKISAYCRENLPASASVENLAYVIYTSGTTGIPKGVMISHRSICNRLLWMQKEFPLEETDRVLQKTPISFDASVWEIFLPLITGSCLILALQGEHRESGQLLKRVKEQQVTILQLVPSMFAVALADSELNTVESLRRIFCGGEALTFGLQERFFNLMKRIELTNLYGPTEVSIDASYWRCMRDAEKKVVPIGHPISNMRIHLLDSHSRLVPHGTSGELYIGGVGLAQGYFKRPELTAERFVPDLYSREPGERLYRSGDIARRLNDGSVEYLGRIDEQVKIRGFRIELGEIETVMNQHPAVRKVAVIVKEDHATGKRLVAYVVLKEDGIVDEKTTINELRDLVRDKLPEYMKPSGIVKLNSLPSLPSGKIDRRALSMLDHSQLGNEKGRLAPRNPLEELLAKIWGQALGVEKVARHDSFLELGGHSLIATQLISRMREAFRVEIPLRLLFEKPTIAELAEAIEKKIRTGLEQDSPPIKPASREGDLPLSFAQQRLWSLDQLEPDSQLFNISSAVRISGPLDVDVLEKCFAEIVRRHEVLRTRFVAENGRPRQVIRPESEWELPLIDLRDSSESERGNRLSQHMIGDAQKPFNLQMGQTFRSKLLRLGDDEYALLLAMHHIVSDAWSMGVFVNEIGAIYEAFSQGNPSPLPELEIQYADFSIWQREWLKGEVIEKHLSYWKRQLDGAPPLLELPTDNPRPPIQSNRGATHSLMLPKTLSDALQVLSKREGVTLFMTLLAAFQTLMRYYTQRDDIVVGTDVANRNRVETERLIGFFINQLVLRTKLSSAMSFRELLAKVREVTLGAYAHQDLPFEQIVTLVNPERTLKYSPLFQVKIVLQNAPAGQISVPGLTLSPMPGELTISKLDLTCLLEEGPEGIGGIFEYNSDLFHASTIARMSGLFEAILSHLVARPDIRLGDLESLLRRQDEEQQAETKLRIKETNFKMFKSLKAEMVNLTEIVPVKTELFPPGRHSLLLIQPNTESADLLDWAANNREFIEKELLKYGSILFRGFNIADVPWFERFTSSLCSGLYSENGEHVRGAISDKVYTPVFYPPYKQLLWHNENSFNHSWPRKIWFGCVQPAERGGETPIVDSRKVFQTIDPKIRGLFIKKGVMYVRNYGNGLGLDWQTVFGTSDKMAVEAHCRKTHMDFEWIGEDRLRTRSVRPAAIAHPLTGEMVWFNQAQHWHQSCLDPDTRHSLSSLFDDEFLPRGCYYGDGSKIEDSVMEEILRVYGQLEVSFPWQKGDILMLDNLLTSHGRKAFVGERKLLVAMAEMLSYEQV